MKQHAGQAGNERKRPAGGWGSVKSLGGILAREGIPVSGGLVLTMQNKTDGFACVSCAWGKPAQAACVRVLRKWRQGHGLGNHHSPSHPDFFAAPTVTDLLAWQDHDLEQQGRLTHPMRWNR